MKGILITLFILIFVSSAKAQDQPKVELFTGYSFSNVQPSLLAERDILNGWNTNLSVNLLSAFGLAADVSGHYGRIKGVDVRMHSASFGPRFSFHGKRWAFFVHNLYGVSHINGKGNGLVPLIGTESDTSFYFVPGGGGIEVKINEKLSYRIVQFDLFYTNFGKNNSQMNTRFSTGIAFHFGKTK